MRKEQPWCAWGGPFLASGRERCEVENIHADFNDAVDNVLQRVQDAPAFFFLDPFGTKDLPMQGLIDVLLAEQNKLTFFFDMRRKQYED